ncbi:diguanylate cyclase (GGDEF) domain-containing protein [Lachnospiraceae bacterium KHCPX20]|nr:diguanylate cyclase (GGDEF) domain-containing protein [Lachnospiraceae bacterium KHCPX20]
MKHIISDSDREFFQQMADCMPGGFLAYYADEGQEIITANDQVVELMECKDLLELRKFTGNSFMGVVAEEDRRLVERQIRFQTKNPVGGRNIDYVQYRVRTASGRIRAVEDFGRMITYKGKKVYTVFLADKEDKRRNQGVDYTTGLIQRSAFSSYARGFVFRHHKNHRISVLWMDIDDFKSYNKLYGYQAGDRLLRQIADVIKDVFGDGVVAHCNEDHYAVMCYRENMEEQITKLLAKVTALSKKSSLLLNIGVYDLNNQDVLSLDIDQMLDHARMACRSIKDNYDVSVGYYHEALGQKVLRDQYVLSHLREAISMNWIKVYYQPIASAAENKIVEMEALARWEDPTYGFLTPDQFIPLLEKRHLIHYMDTCVMEQVARNYRVAVDQGLPVCPVSINLSRLDFEDCDIVAEIDAIRRDYDMPKYMLHIEITESAMNEKDTALTEGIARFTREGYQVWMDDFGSGYSSLNVLKDYRFGVIKFDMQFLRDFQIPEKSERTRKILEAMIPMVRSLGMVTLTEGVETDEEADYLRSIGCQMLQGYFISKPKPFEDVRLALLDS